MSAPNMAIINFTPQALREHFDLDDVICEMSDEALDAIGAMACEWFWMDDKCWELFGECVNAAMIQYESER